MSSLRRAAVQHRSDHGLACGSLPVNGLRSRSSCGLGVRKFTSGGISRCLSASTALIRPATPAAASRCPIFAFSEPIRQKPISGVGGAKYFSQCSDLDRIAERRSRAVRFNVSDRTRIDAGQRLRRRDHFDLAVDARGRIASLASAVVVDGSSADDRMDRVAVGQRIRQAA